MKNVKYLEDVLFQYQSLKSHKIDLPSLTSQLSVWLENLNWFDSISAFLDYKTYDRSNTEQFHIPNFKVNSDKYYKPGSLSFDKDGFLLYIQDFCIAQDPTLIAKILNKNSGSKYQILKDKNQSNQHLGESFVHGLGLSLENSVENGLEDILGTGLEDDLESPAKNLSKDGSNPKKEAIILEIKVFLDMLIRIYRDLYFSVQKTISAENFLVLEMSKHWEKGSFLYSSKMGFKRRGIITCFESLKNEIDSLKTILEIREDFLEIYYDVFGEVGILELDFLVLNLESGLDSNSSLEQPLEMDPNLDTASFGGKTTLENGLFEFLNFWLADPFILFLENKIWDMLQDIIFDGDSYNFVNYKNSSILIFEDQDFDLGDYLDRLIETEVGQKILINYPKFNEGTPFASLNINSNTNTNSHQSPKNIYSEADLDYSEESDSGENFVESTISQSKAPESHSVPSRSEPKNHHSFENQSGAISCGSSTDTELSKGESLQKQGNISNNKVNFLTRFSKRELVGFINEYRLQDWAKKVSFQVLPEASYQTVFDMNLEVKIDYFRSQSSADGYVDNTFPTLLVSSKNNLLLKYQREILDNFSSDEFLIVGETGSLTKIVSKLNSQTKICLIRTRDLEYFMQHANISLFKSVYFLGEPYLGDIPSPQKASKMYLKSQFNWIGQKYPEIKLFYVQFN